MGRSERRGRDCGYSDRVRGMVPADLFEMRWASDPRLSPDGATVAYVVTSIDRASNSYRSEIWLVATDGTSPPRRFTTGGKRDLNPRWSPDGRCIAFASNRESKTNQLYLIDVDGGEARRLTSLKEDVEEHAWSPDGATIAFSSRVPTGDDEEDPKKRRPKRFTRLLYKLDNVGWIDDRRTHLFTIAADGGEPRQVTDGDFEDGAFAWSPDGGSIVFTSARSERWDTVFTRHLFTVPATGGSPEQITAGEGVCDAPSWSPDGTRIAYRYSSETVDDYPRHPQIAVLDVVSGDQRVLTRSLDRNCGPYPSVREPVWSDGQILFGVEDAGNTHVYSIDADAASEPKVVVGGELHVTSFDVTGGVIVHTETTGARLPEVFAGDRRLTTVTEAFHSGREIVAPERFTATSSDGAEIDAWIVRPAAFDPAKKYPVLLNIHGGPFTQYGNGFFDEFQVYAGAGYVVLYSNPRGSSGGTEEWGRAIRGDGAEKGRGFGGPDFDDLMAVTDEALRRFDFCDPDRLGVMGGSYGGFMTTWIAAHTDRFKAGVSERSVNNWVSFFGSSDVGWSFKGYVGSFPFEDAEANLRVSPVSYAERISTPLLLVHSEEDLRAPVEQAEHLFTVLRLLGKEVEFVRFPAESHELSRSGSPVHREMRFETILDWLSGYLQLKR